MNSFLIAGALLVSVVLVAVLVPLMRARPVRGPAEEASPTLAALQRQRKEIDEDFARGALSGEERDAALADLVSRAGEELPSLDAPAVPLRFARPGLIAVTLIVAIPALAIPLYLHLGNPAALESVAHAQESGPQATLDLESAVDKLAKKLEQRPDDADGWMLLARSSYALGRFPEAVAAFERATALRPDDADLRADYADALGMVKSHPRSKARNRRKPARRTRAP